MVNVSSFSPFALSNSPQGTPALPHVLYTKIYHIFNENDSVFFSISGRTVSEWNTTAPIPFEFRYTIQHETPWTNDLFTIVFQVDFFDSAGDFRVRLNKTIVRVGDLGLQWIDGFGEGTWSLPSNLTKIPEGQVWTGEAYMIGSVRVGSYYESNSTNRLNITYSNLPPGSPFQIPVSVFGGVIILILIGGSLMLIRFKKK